MLFKERIKKTAESVEKESSTVRFQRSKGLFILDDKSQRQFKCKKSRPVFSESWQPELNKNENTILKIVHEIHWPSPETVKHSQSTFRSKISKSDRLTFHFGQFSYDRLG
jgi:hypothetical protein